MKKINEDIRSFLVFEGVSLADISDPSIQLPLTQLRADSQKLQAEISVLDKNPGIDSQVTQQELADIEGSLTFLQKKVRLFETSGIINEGFTGTIVEKTRATKDDLVAFQQRIYGAILTLSASGTSDPVVQARIKALQNMYTVITDMITNLNNGTMMASDIKLYKEDINTILPSLANPTQNINAVFNQPSGKELSPIEKGLSTLVGEENATSVFNNLKEKAMFRVSVDLGYNVHGPTSGLGSNGPVFSQNMQLQPDGTISLGNSSHNHVESRHNSTAMKINSAYDTTTQGMDDRNESKNHNSKAYRFDWKKRATSICEQVRKRGMNPEDFGCIAKDSLMSPAYSWRGHTKMICGRLGATMDPNLPIMSGCPPSKWKGWTLSA
jgi:hypothetical protein